MKSDSQGVHTVKSALLGIIGGVGILLAAAMLWQSTVSAATPISQSYSVEEQLPVGSIVSLEDDFADRVTAATITNVDNIFGVVINSRKSLIKLDNGQENKVQVATDGVVDVLVSDMNGTIAKGDHITASLINGVGMKAASNIKVVGVAQAALTEENGHSETYTDESGTESSVLLGEVPVLVGIAYYFEEPEKTIIPAAIQDVANAIAGKPIEPLPVIVSGAIFIVTLIAVASIIYSMIRGSIISVGRNPMSQSAVYRNVMQLTALVVGILAVAVVSIYMVLTRL